MKREIKFRGLRIDGKGWVYGYYWHNIQDDKYLIIESTKLDFMVSGQTQSNSQVIPESVGQFTGLKDRYGVEIFEGDIVIYDTTTICSKIKKWTKKGKEIIYNIKEAMFKFNDDSVFGLIYNQYEVLGNIHENPELL